MLVIRLRSLRNVIYDMAAVVRAFDHTGELQGNAKLLMLCMTASVARSLMLDATSNLQAALAVRREAPLQDAAPFEWR
jgi:hypothetical protein